MNRLLIKARSIARRAGLKNVWRRLTPRRDYEEKFHRAILAGVQAGDIAWDVGANRGFYTKIFCEKTGVGGRVVAFEPAPESFAEVSFQTADYSGVRVEQVALSDFDGTSRLVLHAEASTLHHLQNDIGEATAENSVQVSVVRGDSYWASSGMTPNVLKIDVEGFEEEVLAGMAGLLAAPELRWVFIEVHFRLLEERGRAEAPVRIERLLRSKGLRPRWIDSSHIAAQRVVR
jgi:FkbM family methyltransferase